MIQLANPEPPLELNEQESALSASDFAHLHRALLWLLILFGFAATTSLVINMPTPLFAGMQCYLSWCAIAALIQYFFLRISDLSVAMGALGSNVAIQTADIALMASDLRRVLHFLALSDKTLRIINQNMLCGFVFIAAAIVLSGVGLIPPIAAAFIHEFGAFFVIFNSARLLRFEGKSA